MVDRAEISGLGIETFWLAVWICGLEIWMAFAAGLVAVGTFEELRGPGTLVGWLEPFALVVVGRIALVAGRLVVGQIVELVKRAAQHISLLELTVQCLV